MAVSRRCSGGRGVCEPSATLGCDWHAVNATMLAYGQLLVDDPERIGPIQATGMDQTLFSRVGQYRTQQWATTFDSPLKSEGPQNSLSRLVGGILHSSGLLGLPLRGRFAGTSRRWGERGDLPRSIRFCDSLGLWSDSPETRSMLV